MKQVEIPDYDFKKIEKKWKKHWEEEKTNQPDLDKAKKPFYNLMMFPYPSAEGLHVGNMYAFTGADVFGRYKRMQGYDVFEPIGLDGFGIHSENYAIKIKEHIKTVSDRSEKKFYQQLHDIGNMYDWSRTVETYKPEYYKWTQWLFLQMYKKGLAYQKKAKVNWCPSCKTVLSDEQVIQGRCERCDSEVEKKELKQWFFKITKYADKLLKNLEWIDWSEDVKLNQKNWIGKSEGAKIKFQISNKKLQINSKNQNEKEDVLILHGWEDSSESGFIPETKKYLEQLGHRVFAFDAPNTDKPVFEEWFDFIDAKIQENKLKDFSIIGHSMGGHLAVKLAEKYQLKKIVLITPVGFESSNSKYFNQFEGKLSLEELKIFKKYQDRELDIEKIKGNTQSIQFIFGEKDPWITEEIRSFYQNNFSDAHFQFLENKGHLSGNEGVKIIPKLLNDILVKDNSNNYLEVFTTRPDTIFGATYMVIAPEMVEAQNFAPLRKAIANYDEVKKYVDKALNKSDQERKADEKGKTGIEIKGIKAINPATKKEIPIWVADYVLGDYGTGAIMAVPAHDERDFEFAKKFNLPIEYVVEPYFCASDSFGTAVQPSKDIEKREAISVVVKNPKNGKYLCIKWKNGMKMHGLVTGGIKKGEDIVEAAKREVLEETGYRNLKFVNIPNVAINVVFYHRVKKINRWAHFRYVFFDLIDEQRDKIDKKEADLHEVVWKKEEELDDFFTVFEGDYAIDLIKSGTDKAFCGEGIAANSDFFDGLETKEAKKKIVEWLEENPLNPPLKNGETIGKGSVDYKLRDWCVSRQRYWGPPIPIVHCEKCGTVPVSEKDLPVLLPEMDDFLPEGKGKGPLAKNKEFVEVKCPKCGGPAERETDVSDPFVDSAWYFLRYPSTEFNDKIFDEKRTKKWLPVDSYIGGKEHTVLHLLYSRFITMVLNDLGYIDFDEPYKKFFGHGLITKDGAKMSKSKGNVINPDEMIEEYGADAMRLYLRFLGDFSQGGDWRDGGIKGMSKFVNKLWIVFYELNGEGSGVDNMSMLDKTIKAVGEDLEKLSFNTAMARIMEFVNWIKENKDGFNKEQAEKIKKTLALVIAPLAPFIAEEFWVEARNYADGTQINADKSNDSIFNQAWPEYDPKNIIDKEIELVIQINGKVRDKIKTKKDISEEEAQKIALKSEKIKKHINSKEIKKVIYIKGKLVNIVL
jgi:leucyl-tRNA synthetase